MKNQDKDVIFILAVFLSALFAYKVWNERQMTHEYAGWRVAQERTAAATENLAHIARATYWLPTLGGTTR